MLVLKPQGRGNWATVELVVAGRRAPPPMYFAVGQLVSLGGYVFRVCKVVP